MSRIFLSHSSKEHELAVHLANHLEKNNLQAWYAPRDIVGGIDYDKEIIAAIKDCLAFVLLLSHNSDASEDVKTEVYHAVKFKKQVICLDVDDVEPENLSYLLGMRHRLNWLERRDETLDKLVHDIKRIPEPDSDEDAKPAVKAELTTETKPKAEIKPPVETKPKAEIKPPIVAKPKVETKPIINVPKPEPKIDGFVKILMAVFMVAFVAVLVLSFMYSGKYDASWNTHDTQPMKHIYLNGGGTPEMHIFYLAGRGTPEEIREAAKAGADFTITSDTVVSNDDTIDDTITTLFIAVNTNTPEAVKAITETSVDVNAVASTKSGWTALMQASGRGNVSMVKILIEAGADVNLQAKGYNGLTALMIAAASNRPEIVRFLLEHGADKNIYGEARENAYDYALEHEDFDYSLLELLRPDDREPVREEPVKYKEKKTDRKNGIVVNVPENDVLNVRKRPAVNSSILAHLNNGDIIQINREYRKPRSGTVWYNITDEKTGITGFVASRYVKKLE